MKLGCVLFFVACGSSTPPPAKPVAPAVVEPVAAPPVEPVVVEPPAPEPAPPPPVDPATVPPSKYLLGTKSLSVVTSADMIAALKKAGYPKIDRTRVDGSVTGPWEYISVGFFDKAGGQGTFAIRRPAVTPKPPKDGDDQWSPKTWQSKFKGRVFDEESLIWVDISISGDNDHIKTEKSPGRKLYEAMIKQP
jgi:hypothetical protein